MPFSRKDATSSGFDLANAFVQALPDAVILVGGDYRVFALNAAAERLFPALRLQEALTRGLRAPEVTDAVARVLADAQEQSVLWLDRLPVERSFDVHAAPLNFEGGLCALISLHDATEARRLDRMRADFVANASHELRTPLASILGFIETLQGPARKDEAAREKFLAIMRGQAQRMTRLVDDLLSLSRIEQNLHVAPQTRVDVSELVGHIVDSMRRLAAECGADLSFSTQNPAFALGDRDELLRVLENLIENALKYGESAPVFVSVEKCANHIRLQVADQGPGIAAEHLPRLTERFYRANAGESRAKGGTGLGLAIVKHIVARHRGRLFIESTPGAGAAFTILLPAFEPQKS